MARGKNTTPRARTGRSKKNQELAKAISERRVRVKTDELKIWEQRIDFGRRESQDFQEDCARNLLAYIGKNWEDTGLAAEEIAVALRNYTLHVNRILPSLASQNAQIMPRIPWFMVRARRALGATGTNRETAEAVLNYTLNNPRMNYLQHTRLFLLGGHLGYGAKKTTYTPDEGVDPERNKNEPMYGRLTEEYDEKTGEIVFDVEGGTPRLDDDGNWMVRSGGRILLETRNPADYFKSEWKDFRDFVHDPEGGNDIFDHAWIAERRSWTVEEFRANTLFRNVDKRDIEHAAYSLIAAGPSNVPQRMGRSDIDRAELRAWGTNYDAPELDLMRLWGYEVWNCYKQEVIYIVDGLDDVAAKVSYPGWIDHSPYTFCKFNEVLGEWYPHPSVNDARALSRAYNIFWGMLLNHLRRFNRKYLMAVGAFADPKERETMKDGEDGVCVEVTDLNGIKPLEEAPLDPSIYKMMDQAIADQAEVLSSPPESRGIAQSGSATQAALIDRRSSSRENDYRMLFGTALKHDAKLMLDCLQANLDTPMAFAIAGPQGQQWEGEATRADIVGDFETDVEMSDLEPHDVGQEKRDATALVQILTPQLAFMSPLFTRKFFKLWNWNEPEIAEEFVAITSFLAAGGGQAAAGGPAQPAQDGATSGEARGGAKMTGRGQEEGNTTEGRSVGRGLRGRGESPTLLGKGNTPPANGSR